MPTPPSLPPPTALSPSALAALESSTAHILGSAPPVLKAHFADLPAYFDTYLPDHFRGKTLFGNGIYERLKVTEVLVPGGGGGGEKAEGEGEGKKKKLLETKIVVELDVTTDMVNPGGSLHGGCAAYLVDMCSALSLSALSLVMFNTNDTSVSQAINVIYHSPAAVGDKLRIVNTSMSLGARVQSCRTEIWNATHHRLVVSGTHVKMHPSPPPRANL